MFDLDKDGVLGKEEVRVGACGVCLCLILM